MFFCSLLRDQGMSWSVYNRGDVQAKALYGIRKSKTQLLCLAEIECCLFIYLVYKVKYSLRKIREW